MKPDEIRNVAVIGTGLMGTGIAQIFASSGRFRVSTYDSAMSAKDALAKLRSHWQTMVDQSVLTPEELSTALERVAPADTLHAAVEQASFVVECASENLRLKQDLFAQLDAAAPTDAILATNTSVIRITEIASQARAKDRIVGTHFWNPPYLIPLVEVVQSDHTSEEVMDATMQLLRGLGKHPIRVRRDVPGFVANRLQHALWREAISIVEHGIADAATVDEAIKQGFGLRLPVLGPLENADMVGTDLTLSIHEYLLQHLENSTKPSPLLRQLVDSGALGFKAGRGFQAWTSDRMEQLRTRLTEHLVQSVIKKPDSVR